LSCRNAALRLIPRRSRPSWTWADQEPERCTTCHGLPRSSELLHSAAQRAQPATVQAHEEV
jgi:hypothetical protein